MVVIALTEKSTASLPAQYPISQHDAVTCRGSTLGHHLQKAWQAARRWSMLREGFQGMIGRWLFVCWILRPTQMSKATKVTLAVCVAWGKWGVSDKKQKQKNNKKPWQMCWKWGKMHFFSDLFLETSRIVFTLALPEHSAWKFWYNA